MNKLFLILGLIIALCSNGFTQDITTILPNMQEVDTAQNDDFIYLKRPNTNYPNKLITVEDLLIGFSATTDASDLTSGNLPAARNTETFKDGSQHACIDSGSNDTYVASRATVAAAHIIGAWCDFVPNTINTGAATITLDGLAVKSILRHNGDALQNGDLEAGLSYRIRYDGSAYRIPPAGVSGSGTVVGTLNKIAKFTDTDAVGDSQCVDDGTNISCGDISGNHYVETFSAPSATHTHNNIAQSGDRVLSTGARTSGAIAQYDANGVLVSGKAAVSVTTKQVVYRHGSDTGAVLADTEDETDIWPERIAAMTITSVKCWSDADTVIINLQRNDGSAADILSSNLSCTPSGATGTIAGAEDNLATTDRVDFVMVTAGGVAKRVTVSIMATID